MFSGKKKKKATSLPLRMKAQVNNDNSLRSMEAAHANVKQLGNELETQSQEMRKEESFEEDIHNGTGKTPKSKATISSISSASLVKENKALLTLGREEFFGSFTDVARYPLDKLQEVSKSIMDSPKLMVHLHLSGIEQLSDLILYIMFTLNEKKTYPNVTCLNLTGCLNVTDLGLKYAAKAFPGLTELCVKGCEKVTEAGLYQLVTRCPALHKVNICGTSVAILPRNVVEMDISLAGYPCISPEKDIMEKHGLKIMKASLYAKPADKDLMKTVVIQPSGAETSLIKHLQYSKENFTIRPLSTLIQFALTDRFTTNVVQCDEVLSDLFITRRALYVLTIGAQESQKDGCQRIFSLMCHILNKVQHAVFVLVSMKSGKETTALEAIKSAVAALASTKSAALGKMVREELKKNVKAGNTQKTGSDQDVNLYSKQELNMFMRKLMLSKALKKVSIECVEVDTVKPYKKGDELCNILAAGMEKTCLLYPEMQELAGPMFKLIQSESSVQILKDLLRYNFKGDELCNMLATGMEKTCLLYPEMQELAGPMFKFIQSESSVRILKDGIASLAGSKLTAIKIMELMEVMGRAVHLPLLQEPSAMCLVDWLGRVVSQAFAVPPGVTNENRVLGVPGETPMWILEDLKKELQKTLPEDQASSGAMLLVKAGLSVNPSVFISHKDLPDQPNQSLETFFPEIPPTEKKKDLFYTVGYKAELDTPLPGLIVQRMMSLCSRTKRPSLMWKHGFILLDSCVETLFLLDPADTGAALYIYSHTVREHQGALEEGILQEMVWNTLLPYKIIFDYVLMEMSVPHTLKQVAGDKSPAKVFGLVEKHEFEAVLDENDDATGEIICHVCNESPRNTELPWLLHSSLEKPFMQSSMFETLGDEGVHRSGNVFTFRKQGAVSVRSLLFPGNQMDFKVGLLTDDASRLRLGLGYGYIPKKGICSGGFFLDLSTGVLSDMMSQDRYDCISKENLPKAGNTVTLRCCAQEKHAKDMELKIYRDTELVLSRTMPKKDYVPIVQSPEDKTKDYQATIVVHPLYTMEESEIVDLQAGMRLEAKDRKNPNLVCVATIQEIKEDGQLLVHFDGWTSTYDYIADPRSADLHPIGYMESNTDERVNRLLQAPNKYGKSKFTWEEYCRDNEIIPVPFGWFTGDQRAKTKIDRYESVMRELDVSQLHGDFHTSCKRLIHRPKVLEKQALMKCMSTKDVFDFFTKHNKFYCLMPDSLNIHSLRNPSLQSIMDFSRQNVHILCPGIKTELLHFVDYKGTPIPSGFRVSDEAAYLQSCFIGLLLQESFFPRDCLQLISGMETITDKGQYEVSAERLFFIYVCILELHATKAKGSKAPVMDLFSAVEKDKDAVALFSDKDQSPRCKGHAGSFMGNNELREIPLDQFSHVFHLMSKLDFQNNLLMALPQDFFVQFKCLESLNLANNRLEQLPEGIGNLKELEDFDLSGNKISALPKDFSGIKGSLIALNISDNPLDGLPKVIFELTNLKELLAENVGVITNLAEIMKLKSLEVLHLGKNSIDSIPDGLGDLQLSSLDLSGVPWFPSDGTFQSFRAFMLALRANHVTGAMTEKEMQELFTKCDADESSSLTANEIIELNYNSLFPKYPRLGIGKLSYPDTDGFPPCIFRLVKLRKLVLRYQGLQSVPDNIKNLDFLTELDLSFNPKLVSVSAELGGCPIKHFHLQDCIILNTPPKEIVARGVTSIMGYLKRLKLGASPCKRTKLMMVGLGGAGKTSLVSSLINAQYRAYLNSDEPITDGIDIKNWVVPIDKEKKDMLTYSVWDFAGQTVYYNTHQFFLSNRGVYLLLWNVRQGSEHAGLDFWLSSIACHAPRAPIMLIGTHIDKVEKFHLAEDDLKARYPQIAGFHYISSYTGKGVPELKEALISLTLKQKYMGERIPAAWLTLEKRLIAHREATSTDIMPYKQLDAISNECGIFDRTELVQAVQFLHDLGAVQFFNKDFLRDMVVIYPQWIVDVMACLVTVHEGAVKDGRLMLRDVGTVWKAYPKELHSWLLRLTEEFDLTCPLQEEDASIVPCLLPDTEPKYDWPHAQPEKNIHESITVYRFQYLPAGLFNRAQVRLHQYSKGSLLWQKGSYMKKNGHICLMLQTKDQEVIVRAQGFRPDNFLFLVHEMIETLITESYTGVQYDFLIPCMDCVSMNVKDPSMVSRIKVQRALELNVPFLQCKKFFHILSIQELRDAMPSDKMSDMDNHLRNSVRELIELTDEATISVFFVFTSKNQPSLSDPDDVVHPGTVLEDLRKQEHFKVSYTDKPETSNMEALSLSMKAANVTIIGMSDEFCADPECKKLLLYAKDVLRRPVLLLLLGKTKNWQKTDINLSVGTEVYVDMTKKERYPHKIKELYEALKKKAAVKSKIKDDSTPKCFLSYCWTNSHDAISKGSRPQEGSLGWDGGDPRKVREFLGEKGTNCWIDVERVGGVGLFHSIADGLQEAEVMVAFVSDEYVKSRNCVMEFRYALSSLRIPVILVVVGTGYEWERSEVGLLAVGQKCPKINLQYENPAGYLALLKFVQDHSTKAADPTLTKETAENQRNIAFQEVLELTQRKFLRHMYTTVIDDSSEPYPGLILVDFLTEKEKINLKAVNKTEVMRREKTIVEQEQKEKEGEKKEEEPVRKEDDDFEIKSKFCFRILCENPEGWHVTESFVTFPELDHSDEQQLIDSAAPYLGRVYAIARHSNIQLECLTTPEGEIFQQRVEEIGVKSASDFKNEYQELRNAVIQQDKGGKKHNLHRTYVNGKMVWLCNSHKMASRSKTEMRFGQQQAAGAENISIPTDDPEAMVAPTPLVEDSRAPQAAKAQRKVFKRSSNQKPQMKRTTSQACSVM